MARSLVGNRGNTALAERLGAALGAGWRVIEAPPHSAGEADLVAFNEAQGAALVTAHATSAAPIEAAAAFRRLLEQRGLAAQLGGHLPIVAVSLAPGREGDIAAALREAFLAEPPLAATPGWAARVEARLAPAPARAAPTPRAAEPLALRADRDDAWRVMRDPAAAATPVGVAVTPEEHVVPEETVREGGVPLWTGMALAVVVVSAVLAGMWALSYGNGPGGVAAPAAQVR